MYSNRSIKTWLMRRVEFQALYDFSICGAVFWKLEHADGCGFSVSAEESKMQPRTKVGRTEWQQLTLCNLLQLRVERANWAPKEADPSKVIAVKKTDHLIFVLLLSSTLPSPTSTSLHFKVSNDVKCLSIGGQMNWPEVKNHRPNC